MATPLHASDAFKDEVSSKFVEKEIPIDIRIKGVVGSKRHQGVNGEYTLTSGIEDWQLSYTHKTTSDLKLAL